VTSKLTGESPGPPDISRMVETMKRLFSYFDITGFSRGQKIHFFINVSVGIIIAVFCHFIEHTDWGEDTINKALDFVIVKEAEKSAAKLTVLDSPRDPRISNRIVFIDIDHETYKNWGKPLITPRDKLAEVVKAAYEGGALIIILDILFEHKDCCHPESDSKLRKVLQDMARKSVPTQVIFPLRIGSNGDAHRSLYEDLIQGNPRFHFATANISATATDRVVRYWTPFETIKDGGNNRIIWNMPFLAAVLAEGKEEALKGIEKALRDGNPVKSHRLVLDRKRQIIFESDREDIYRSRIRFFLLPKNTLPRYPGGTLFDTLYRIDEVADVNFKDRIVIIGNSSPDIGDTHPTPVGNMAGMFILGNATNTILLGVQPSRAPVWLNMSIEAMIIIMAAFLFLYLSSFLALVIGSTVMILTLGVFSYYYFLHTGAYLNFVFAVVGMSFHRTVADIEDLFMKKGRH